MRALYIALCLGLIVYGGIRDANAMRCNKRIISEGDTIGKLYRFCGKPLYTYYSVFQDKYTLTYEINGREKVIIAIHGIIRSGV